MSDVPGSSAGGDPGGASPVDGSAAEATLRAELPSGPAAAAPRAGRASAPELTRWQHEVEIGATIDARAERAADGVQERPDVLPPLEVLRLEEAGRTRRMSGVVLVVGVMVLAILPFLGGNPIAKAALYGGILLGLGGTWGLGYMARRPERFRGAKVDLCWSLAAVATYANTVYFGMASAAVIIMVLVVYSATLSHRPRVGTWVWAGAALTHAAVGVPVLFGATDPGIVQVSYLPRLALAVGVVLCQGVLLIGWIFGRANRQARLESIERLQRAVRAVAQRDAMVEEVRQELARAARGGAAGRLTGQILGSFELGEVIGRGGMGEVYLAAHRRSRELAAVKVLLPAFADDADVVARFVREARAAGALDSPYVVRVLESGGADAGSLYIAMELLRGHDLGWHLRERGRLSHSQVAHLVREAALGLAAAGRAEIVHRDIKPQNLFLAEPVQGDPVWKILDFGVSKLLSQNATATGGDILGTPAYMAPEQALGRDTSHRTDIYALAAVSYRALTGFPPFPGHDVPSVLYALVHTMPVRPSTRADLPPAIDSVLAVGLAKNPAQRYQSAEELAAAVEAALEDRLDPDLRRRADELLAASPWASA